MGGAAASARPAAETGTETVRHTLTVTARVAFRHASAARFILAHVSERVDREEHPIVHPVVRELDLEGQGWGPMLHVPGHRLDELLVDGPWIPGLERTTLVEITDEYDHGKRPEPSPEQLERVLALVERGAGDELEFLAQNRVARFVTGAPDTVRVRFIDSDEPPPSIPPVVLRLAEMLATRRPADGAIVTLGNTQRARCPCGSTAFVERWLRSERRPERLIERLVCMRCRRRLAEGHEQLTLIPPSNASRPAARSVGGAAGEAKRV